ncbi:hypothetical protein RF11_02437 [Thelohanellus kitauei]|uniref:Uncharacterized protein n=1 Tax=Thelohanellus kitauei TaxID=669202 RepID=A0A0C2ILD2_THEKT|nr:hypothetical protein RF11_02437 [Thelohanellus kitauei]
MRQLTITDEDISLSIQIPEYIWPSSPILACYVLKKRHKFVHRKLSAGTALPAIVAAKLGALVTVSEKDDFSLLRSTESIKINDVHGIETMILKWGAFEHASTLYESRYMTSFTCNKKKSKLSIHEIVYNEALVFTEDISLAMAN